MKAKKIYLNSSLGGLVKSSFEELVRDKIGTPIGFTMQKQNQQLTHRICLAWEMPELRW